MKFKILGFKFNNKKECIKILFLIQALLVVLGIAFFSSFKWNLIDENYNPIAINTILAILLILSGFVGIGSIYIFNEIVNLIEKEKEYEMQTLQIAQMKEANDLLRSQKHDFSNNVQVIWGLLGLGNIEKAKEYLKRYTNTFKVDEEELIELRNLSCKYLYTLLLNKAYKCKDLGIEIYYNIQPFVSLEGLNPIDIVRILGNLLDNAIYEANKLQEDCGAIYVDIIYDDENYTFRVVNEGTAICEKIKNKIFEKGFTTKGNEGSGIGLYNVKELVKKYNGKIHIKSDTYTGTHFIIEIPKVFKKKTLKKKVINI